MARGFELGTQMIDGLEASVSAWVHNLDLPQALVRLHNRSEEREQGGHDLEHLHHPHIVAGVADIECAEPRVLGRTPNGPRVWVICDANQGLAVIGAGGDPCVSITLTVMADFIATWRRVQQHAGQAFTTVRGKPFRYSASEGGIYMLTTNRVLPRADFEEALRRMPVSGPGALQDLQGPSYIYAILNDPRVK
jgi:hypothetical protein